jgi:hypothetical protein
MLADIGDIMEKTYWRDNIEVYWCHINAIYWLSNIGNYWSNVISNILVMLTDIGDIMEKPILAG